MEPFNILKVRTTISQMMTDRGYAPRPYQTEGGEANQRVLFERYIRANKFSLQSFNKFLENWIPVIEQYNSRSPYTVLPNSIYGVLSRLSMFEKTKDDGTKSITWVIFNVPSEDDKVGIDEVKALLTLLEASRIVGDAIFITNTQLGSDAQKHFDANKKFNIQHYFYRDLEFNPTHHTYVPKHTVLSKEEAKAFFEKNKVLPNQLPSMVKADPIAKYFGVNTGDIIHIERLNLRGDTLVNNYSFFRRVI